MKCAYSQTIEIEELTPIEALDELYDTSTCANANEKYNIVKNALTRLEKLEKAIKIVKRISIKEITIVNLFNDFNSYTEWYKKYFKENGFLNLDESFIPIQTEEEFNLLKEVFGK